jgi:hypothetical protein
MSPALRDVAELLWLKIQLLADIHAPDLASLGVG